MLGVIISAAAVAIGGACGALARWAVSSALNAPGHAVQPGTLAVNIVGAFVIGAASRWLMSMPSAPPTLRLVLVTGFLGALTTFSTFSLETVELLKSGRLAAAAAMTALHLGGSLCATALGMAVCGRFVS